MTSTFRGSSILQLLQRTFEVIRTDSVVLFPSLIVAFLMVLSGNLLQGILTPDSTMVPSGRTIAALITAAALNLLGQAMTTVLAAEALDGNIPNIAKAFIISVKRFILLSTLMLMSVCVAGAFAFLVNLLPKPIGTVIWIPMIFVLMTFFQLFPVIIMLEMTSVFGHIRIVSGIFRDRFQDLLRYFLVITLFSVGAVVLSIPASMSGTPMLIKKIVPPLVQGMSGALTVIVSVVFYRTVKRQVRTDA